MKTLYLIRHAKSSWEDINLRDFDRPLNERGEKDAPRMAKRLKERDIHPNLLVSSPAKRALATCKAFAKTLGYSDRHIKTDERIYHADEDTLLEVIRSIKNSCDTVMLFGHNPGLTDFVNEFGEGTYVDNIPTCGVVAYRFPVDSWEDVDWKKGELLFFDFPKNRKD